MSHKASHWLASLPPRAMMHSDFRVLFHLCDAHNSKRDPETACFPSQETLRQATGLSNGGLNNSLNRLERSGLIRRRRTRAADGTKGPTFYILGCDVETAAPTPKNGGGTNSKFGASPTPNFALNHLHACGDKPVKEPVKEPARGRTRPPDGPPALPADSGRSARQSPQDIASIIADLQRKAEKHGKGIERRFNVE